MAKRLPQAVWDERGKRAGLEWLGPVGRNDEEVLARCLSCGDESLRSPARVAKGQGCAKCAYKKNRVNESRWQQFATELWFEWLDGYPETLDDRSKIGRCTLCGSTWPVTPRALYRGSGHPRCPTKISNTGQRVSFEEWQERAHVQGLKFLEEPKNSKSPTLARCLSCGHEWKPRPINVSHLGSGCPRCRVSVGATKAQRSKARSQAERMARYVSDANALGVEWIGEPPRKLSTKHRAKCSNCGHVWEPWVSNVITKKTGCPVCARNVSIPQVEWDRRAAEVGLRWSGPVKARHKKTSAKCVKCGNEQEHLPGKVASGHGCGRCGAQKSALNRRMGSDTWKQRARERNLQWLELPGNNSEKRSIECLECGHIWELAPVSLRGCPVCTGNYVSNEEWKRRASAKSLRWIAEPTNSRRKSPIECLACGLAWETTPGSLSSGTGCPDCAETGFKQGKPAFLYFIQDPQRGARKIGISNEDPRDTRLSAHRRNGFSEVRLILSHHLGHVIAELESRAMAWIRVDQGLPQFLGKEDMPQRGWTETFGPEGPSNAEVVSKLEDLAEELF